MYQTYRYTPLLALCASVFAAPFAAHAADIGTVKEITNSTDKQPKPPTEQEALHNPPPAAVNPELPSDEAERKAAQAAQPPMTREQAKEELRKNPELLEYTISLLIKKRDAKTLEELLPLYKDYPNRDESLIDWSNAIIAMDKGDVKTAIRLYRKINAALPNIRTVRFELAVALYRDKQYEAAKNELIKLRSDPKTTPADVKALNNYIEAINKRNRWDVSFNFNYLNDDNITNAPKEGTTYENLSLTSPHQSGHGIGYGLYGDKKFALSDQIFAALHLSGYGSYYWDNKNYNEANAGVGVGIGYQNANLEVELQPKFNQRWYGLGSRGDGDLHKYSDTKGVGLSVNYWFNPQWSYQNYTEWNDTGYEEPYTINDGKFTLFSNTLMYLPTQRRYFYGGLDYLNKNGSDDDQSYDRKGIRLGWGEAWERGISTRVSVGYGKKDYDAPSRFTKIQGEDKEYSANFSIWKRDLYLLGLTPRVTWQYNKVTSNDPFNEYSKNNVNLAFTKTF